MTLLTVLIFLIAQSVFPSSGRCQQIGRISVSDIDQIYADNIVCDTVDIDEVAGCIIAIIVLLLWGRYYLLANNKHMGSRVPVPVVSCGI